MKNATTKSRAKTTKTMTKAKSGATSKATKSAKSTAARKLMSASANSTTAILKVGQKAPAFSLLDDKGKKTSLANCQGKKVVLYFYPKDDTPGCTKESCAFRDGITAIKRRGAVVFGVSADSVESHQKFSKKFSLNFPLLSDVDKTMLTKYGVWKEKSLYGRKFMGIERTTFLIDKNGKIAKIFPKVKVDQHYDEVLSALDEMS